MPEVDLLAPLHQYWGYSSFRPLQERIVRSLVAGHDTCVIMPTGGGKSLCYQLPALVLGKTTVVISPLIALMQDQAAQLAQMGIPAAVLNSMMSSSEQSRIMVKAREGGYRLLYLSPERLAREDTIGWLRHVPISFFAIDEAHCISEWGHEFRPDYRLLSRLRAHFPQAPIAAFTASATQRVRHDILHQLQLRTPHKYIASFHRPNLRYAVKECKSHQMLNLLLTLLRNYREGNIIIYEPTIARVEQTVDFLEENGFAATAYHGKMEPALRKRNQEAWMSDEVRVLVGTIAFGLGINKATVRAVIHMSLPKSIEQYYQEAGRAGRDGNPADCILLWQKQGRRPAGALHEADHRFPGARPRLAALSHHPRLRRFDAMPAAANLRALRREAQVGNLRRVRRVQRPAGRLIGNRAARTGKSHCHARRRRSPARLPARMAAQHRPRARLPGFRSDARHRPRRNLPQAAGCRFLNS